MAAARLPCVCIMVKKSKAGEPDTIVVPGYYAYLLRVDYIGHTQEQIIKMLEQFIDEEEIYAYHIFEEVAKVSKKLHIQSIVWSEKDYNPTQRQHCRRTYFKSVYDKGTSHVAFTNAKKPQNLASYSAKDMEMIQSNLTDEELKRIPEWQDTKEFRDKEWQKLKDKKCKSLAKLPIREFMIQITDFHWKNKRQQPARNQMIKLLGIYHKDYNADMYVSSLGILPAHIEQEWWNQPNIYPDGTIIDPQNASVEIP